MSWVRSRWTVVALVPAFFLAGFGIVSALADGSDDSDATSPAGSTTSTADAATMTGEGAPASPTSGAGSATGPGGAPGLAGGSGGGGAPPQAPAPGGIDVDYGLWDGMFELANPAIVPDFGIASVVGELRYLGGVDCPVGLVRVRTWFYGESGALSGETVWESVQSTGEGGEVTGREPLPFEAVGQISELPASAALRFVAVECL